MKKFLKVIVIGVVIIVVAFVYHLYLGMKGDLPPDIVIDGKEFSTDDTVQDLLDAGFLIGNVKKEAYDIEKMEDIKGKTYSSDFYYIGKKGTNGKFEYTGIIISVYNNSMVGCSFAEGKIYDFR